MFDKVNNYLIGMPLTDHVGTSKYILRATDIKGAFTDVHLTAKVASLENEVVSQVGLSTHCVELNKSTIFLFIC